MRDPIPSGTEDAIKRAAGGNQLVSRFGGDDNLDQPVEYRIRDTRPILRSFDRCRLRTEIRPQGIFRRRRKTQALSSCIEIEVVHAAPILNRIDDAQACNEPDHLEVFDIGEMMRLESGLIDQKLDLDRPAIRHDPLSVDEIKARFVEQLRRMAQPPPVLS